MFVGKNIVLLCFHMRGKVMRSRGGKNGGQTCRADRGCGCRGRIHLDRCTSGRRRGGRCTCTCGRGGSFCGRAVISMVQRCGERRWVSSDNVQRCGHKTAYQRLDVAVVRGVHGHARQNRTDQLETAKAPADSRGALVSAFAAGALAAYARAAAAAATRDAPKSCARQSLW